MPSTTNRRGSVLELTALATFFVLAILLRWPYLQDIPRFTDELQEVLWALAISQGEILPLTAVDSYYGPIWSYLLAGLFALVGPSPELPRIAAALIGSGLVALTYLFARDVAGHWPAFIAAGLMLTSGGHVIINSHTARSNSLTPLFTTAALWLVFRALSERPWDSDDESSIERRPDPRLLVPAGLLLGLALQTHLSVIALLPGVAAYVLWKGLRLRDGLLVSPLGGQTHAPTGIIGSAAPLGGQPRDAPRYVGRGQWAFFRSPWPYLGVLAALIGYWNMIVYNVLNDFWSFRHASSLQAGYTGGRPTDGAYYLANLGNLLQSLSRLLSGTIDGPDSPARFVYLVLAIAGLALLARRGGLLFMLASISVIAVLPYFNPRYGPILSGRYLIPLLPLAFTAIGCAVAVGLSPSPPRGERGSSRSLQPFQPSRRWRTAAAGAGLALVLFPLLPLHRYYQDAVADGRTNLPLHKLVEVVTRTRQPDEIVVLDEGLGQEQLGAGGTDLKAFRMLLATRGIPYEIGKVSEVDAPEPNGSVSALLLMESRKRSSLPGDLRATAVGPEAASASGSDHRYAVYRLTSR